MKIKNIFKDTFQLAILTCLALILIICSKQTRSAAADGLNLAINTVIPSLLPLLIIFLTVMKSSSNNILISIFGDITKKIFNLPKAATPAILFGLTGGYPTGAVLTKELFNSGDIDAKQAQRLMCWNFCGGCGFIITAVGTVIYGDSKIGLMLFSSNVISAVTVGFLLSFTQKRTDEDMYIFKENLRLGDALCEATNESCTAVLCMSAYITLFSAICGTADISPYIMPLLEITNGVCRTKLYLPLTCAFLSFGGLCIHLQIFSVISQIKMSYAKFLIFRLINAALSYAVIKIILLISPVDVTVFANNSTALEISSANITLSVLLIVGCFVSVLDLNSKKLKNGS